MSAQETPSSQRATISISVGESSPSIARIRSWSANCSLGSGRAVGQPLAFKIENGRAELHARPTGLGRNVEPNHRVKQFPQRLGSVQLVPALGQALEETPKDGLTNVGRAVLATERPALAVHAHSNSSDPLYIRLDPPDELRRSDFIPGAHSRNQLENVQELRHDGIPPRISSGARSNRALGRGYVVNPLRPTRSNQTEATAFSRRGPALLIFDSAYVARGSIRSRDSAASPNSISIGSPQHVPGPKFDDCSEYPVPKTIQPLPTIAAALEARCLLATDLWTSPDSGPWDVASNWSTGKVPGANDDVIINVVGADPTVTISSSVESVRSITAADPLNVSGGGLTVTANSTINGALTMTGGSLTVDGRAVSLAVTGTTAASGASLYAEGGSMLSLAQLASYTGGTGYGTTLQASGAGSVLSLPTLATITESSQVFSSLHLQALSGGDVELPALTQATGPVTLGTDASGDTLDAPLLATFTGGTITDGGGAVKLPALADADGSNIDVSGGVTLSLGQLTGYNGGTGYGTTIQAAGAGSVLSLPALATITEPTQVFSLVQVEAQSGGQVELPALSQATGYVTLESGGSGSELTGAGGSSPATASATGINIEVSGGATLSLPQLAIYTGGTGYGTTLQASGAGSVLSLPTLATITESSQVFSSLHLQALSGGDVELPALTQATGPVTLGTDASGDTLDAPLLATFTGGTITDGGGAVKLPALADADGSNIDVSRGVTLSLGQLTGYNGGTGYGTTIQASAPAACCRCPRWRRSPGPPRSSPR